MAKRSVRTVAGGVVAATLAALLALFVNLGVLRAAGVPAGPGRLPVLSLVDPSASDGPQVSPSWPGETSARPGTSTPPPSSGGQDSERNAGLERYHEYGARNDD